MQGGGNLRAAGASAREQDGVPSHLLPDMARHFLETLALEGRFNLHARFLAGINDHHKIEALFKALAKALDAATRLDPRIAGQVPSTKGFIET